ncbi:MAG TPA: hypothetical protein PKE27_07980 [Povalibacter sp.]|uniref:hypothetical protein n=1 Tax=Povalibacter sp. TaxID=1962978 RepID=UPI002C6AB055|nr:hypothetical protein [Povalibacter sp.]HMN44494.1 hypothetical protein [Povalibacter sp.]
MINDWINIIALGAVLGAIGQAARGIVGWKKVFDEAQSLHTSAREIFSPSRLVVSLLVGAVAGVLATLTLVDDPAKLVDGQSSVQFKQFLLALVATGYAGTDFIEGFVRNRYSPAATPVTSAAARSDVVVADHSAGTIAGR